MLAKSVICLLTIFLTLMIVSAKDCENVPGINRTLKPGEQACIPGECMQVTCFEEGNIGALGCALYVPQEGYKLSKINYSKPYPECCPQPIPVKELKLEYH